VILKKKRDNFSVTICRPWCQRHIYSPPRTAAILRAPLIESSSSGVQELAAGRYRRRDPAAGVHFVPSALRSLRLLRAALPDSLPAPKPAVVTTQVPLPRRPYPRIPPPAHHLHIHLAHLRGALPPPPPCLRIFCPSIRRRWLRRRCRPPQLLPPPPARRDRRSSRRGPPRVEAHQARALRRLQK